MTSEEEFQLGWLEPWEPADEDDAFLATELEREVSPPHPLHGVGVRVLGRGKDDDVVFALLDGTQVATVHLTWAGRPETPPWPSTQLYADFAAFRTQRMQPDHDALFGPQSASATRARSQQDFGRNIDPAETVRQQQPTHGQPSRMRTALLCGAVVLASVVALWWQWQQALIGRTYSARLVIFATGTLVLLALLPAALLVEKRGWTGWLKGGKLIAAVAIVGVIAGFADWAAMIKASEVHAAEREAVRAQEAIDAHARSVKESAVPLTPLH